MDIYLSRKFLTLKESMDQNCGGAAAAEEGFDGGFLDGFFPEQQETDLTPFKEVHVDDEDFEMLFRSEEVGLPNSCIPGTEALEKDHSVGLM